MGVRSGGMKWKNARSRTGTGGGGWRHYMGGENHRNCDERMAELLVFQAEDGIRDIGVTGVQTCALPISPDERDATVSIPAASAASPEGASVTRGTARDAVSAQHARYGGIKWGAAFFGWLSANGLAVILIALLSAAGVALGLSQGLDTADEAAEQVGTGIGI